MTHRHLFLAKNELFAPLTLEKKNPDTILFFFYIYNFLKELFYIYF
jgi:hypothetical protein